MWISIHTSFSYTRRCFVCRRRDRGRRIINKNSIANVFLSKNIIIPNQSFACIEHFDNYGNLRKEEYNNIKVFRKLYDSNAISTLKAVANFHNQVALFDKFKDFKTLSDVDCLNSTGWSKVQFQNFADHITSIRENKKRNKYQLIALYRYWLCKGIDQNSLSLLKSKTTQQQISNYLKEIRNAIYKDFVPLFLGSNSKTREEFLKHNNEISKELFNLNGDTIGIVADGSYIKTERSANNDFQYKTYSVYKTSISLLLFAAPTAT